ncbi:MAG: TlpA family protein disulfide reductase [Candidatus Dormibacteria bacterium]
MSIRPRRTMGLARRRRARRGSGSDPPRHPRHQLHQQPDSTSVQPSSWELPKLTGAGTLELSDLLGHPVVLDSFAPWCTAFRGELPGMVALSRQLAGRVTFAGVDSQQTGDGLGMARQYGADAWPLASVGQRTRTSPTRPAPRSDEASARSALRRRG